jgi:hypothetical protein
MGTLFPFSIIYLSEEDLMAINDRALKVESEIDSLVSACVMKGLDFNDIKYALAECWEEKLKDQAKYVTEQILGKV